MSTKIVEGESGRVLQLDPSSAEPLLNRAIITAAVSALLAAAVSFGLPLTDTQQDTVTALAVVVVPLALAWWARRKAWSGKAVAEVLDRQLDQVTRP